MSSVYQTRRRDRRRAAEAPRRAPNGRRQWATGRARLRARALCTARACPRPTRRPHPRTSSALRTSAHYALGRGIIGHRAKCVRIRCTLVHVISEGSAVPCFPLESPTARCAPWSSARMRPHTATCSFRDIQSASSPVSSIQNAQLTAFIIAGRKFCSLKINFAFV